MYLRFLLDEVLLFWFRYVYYCMKYVEMFLKKNFKLVLVFDGCYFFFKKDVEKLRREWVYIL